MTALRVHGRSDTGRVRQNNEDHFFFGVMEKGIRVGGTNLIVPDAVAQMSRLEADLLVVADGVGGAVGGERASQSAVYVLATYVGRTAACHFDPDVEQEDEFLLRLERALQQAHTVVRSLGGASRGPATTLTLAMVVGERAYIAHVGDSRAYHLRRGRLRQLTRDQTVASMLSDAGMDAPRISGGMANVLSSAIGAQSMTPAIGLVDLAPGDWLLLCTDGLTKHVSDDRIAAILGAAGSEAEACNRLVDEALEGGGSDNVTVVTASLHAVP